MRENGLDLQFYVVEIRKIAAAHQSGLSLLEAKRQVDSTIQHMRINLRDDKSYQARQWSTLLDALKTYNRNTVDPRWAKVINHANFRIKSRLNTVIYYRKRLREQRSSQKDI